jgi:hypothetical protein
LAQATTLANAEPTGTDAAASAATENAVQDTAPQVSTKGTVARAMGLAPYVNDATLRSIVNEAFASEIVITAKSNKERDGFTPEQRKTLDKHFAEASMTYCMHADGLKHQPASIGNIQLSGLLILPTIVAAIMKDRCKL